MAKKRFALIGAGVFGEMHARAYSSYPGVEFAVVCDLNRDRAKAIASKYGAGRFCTDWREVALDAGIDAASVATPDFAHTEIAVALARAGKHLLVEKPMATTVPECEQILAAAKEGRVKLMVDFHNRWNPPLYEAHRMLRAGELGSPRFISFRLSDTTYVPREMIGWADRSSVLWFLGSHAIDMVCWLVGEWPHRVYSVSRRTTLKEQGVDTPDFFQSTLEFPGGAVASIENSWLLPPTAPTVFDMKCQVQGSEGTVFIDASSNRTMAVEGKQRYSYLEVAGAPNLYGKQRGFLVESILHFADCVLHDQEPLVPGEVGLEVTRVACAIEESARIGQPVEVKR
jgi:predicted dehydrogenase